jgi:hypothetical protein
MTERAPSTAPPAEPPAWQQLSLQALAALEVDVMPALEVLFIDDLAGYLMGAGPLAGPYTVEQGSRVVSALFEAMTNAARYIPADAPEPTPEMTAARAQIVQGAHEFAERGLGGVNQLVNRLIPAILGELEIYQNAPEDQTCSLFYFSLLAVGSGPQNLMPEEAAGGVMELFRAWDAVFGRGFIPPWRKQVTG